MDRLIKVNDKVIIDLNNYHDKIDETEDLNIFETINENGVSNNFNDKISQKIEIKRYVDIFVNLLKDKNIKYNNPMNLNNNVEIIKIFQAINNFYIKNEEFHSLRLMMLIFLKNHISQYVNTYLSNIIKNYEKNKYKKETSDFNNLIYSKKDEDINDYMWNNNEEVEMNNLESKQNEFLFITFLSKNIIEDSMLLENLNNNSNNIKEEEWAYIKEKILKLIKNSCIINDKKINNSVDFIDLINKNMYKNFKKYNSIIEMRKFNICLFFIDIFFNVFLIDYPCKWSNLMENILDTFNFISIFKNNDFKNVINTDYYSTMNYIMYLIQYNDSLNFPKELRDNELKDNYIMVLHFQKFYSLIALMSKILKKYVSPTQSYNYYSILYHNYYISHINNSNKDLLETKNYSSLNIPCENLLLGYKEIMKIFFPFLNRLLCYLLNYTNNIYIIFIIKKIIKFLYKTLLCHFATLPEEVISENEMLFTNIMKIIDINLHEYVNNLYFININTSNKTHISVSKITEEYSYENLSEFIHNEKNDLDKLFLIILLKTKKWCLKILNMFLYRSLHFEDMNTTWKLFLKHFENKYIIFLEKISFLILKIIINTTYKEEERNNTSKLFSYIKYIINFTDYLKFADKCLSLSINYLCMIVSLDHLKIFVKQNIMSEIFMSSLFIHINSSSHIECVDNFFINNINIKEESMSFENFKFERYVICFEKNSIYTKYLLNEYDDTVSKNILKKYVNYIIFLFCELLEKYFYDTIFYLDQNIKDNLKNCLMIQNEYMHLLYPEIFLNEEIDFSNNDIVINHLKKNNYIFNSEICMKTANYNTSISNIIDYISVIIKNHMKENEIYDVCNFPSFNQLNNDTFNNLIFIIKNLPLYKFSQEELIFKDLYSKHNKYNLNFSFLIVNDINLYKFFSLFMFLTYYKYIFIKKNLEKIITEEVLEENNEENIKGLDKQEIIVDNYIEEYYKNKENYTYFFNDDDDRRNFECIINDFKINDKSFFLKYILVNIHHPYSNNLKRKVLWMIREYINITQFDDNVIYFFFYNSFINLFYFEKHLKFQSFDTLINLMHKFGFPSKVLYNDFREILIFLFFQLLILFIKKESNSIDNEFFEENINIVLDENSEKINFLKCIKENSDYDFAYDSKKLNQNYLLFQINAFTDNFINDIISKNLHFYLEKIEENNLNKFLKFISLFFQNEINNNIFLFINLLNESLLDISTYISGRDKEYFFLRVLKFFSFFLENYKNTCSTHDVLIISILQNENFIFYFKSIIRETNTDLREEILNEIFYILYIFTKNSLSNYKVFWFYFLYSLECISNNLNFFQLKEINKLEQIPIMPIYVFQFFNNLIKRDIFYIFFSSADEQPFTKNNLNITIMEILRKISLLLISLSDENLNEQNFYHNITLHICGLYLYNNILSYLIMFLIKNNIFFTYSLWNKLTKAYELIQDENELSDIDDDISNYSFKTYDEAKKINKSFDSNKSLSFDDKCVNENNEETENNFQCNNNSKLNYSKKNKINYLDSFECEKNGLTGSINENYEKLKQDVLFYRGIKNYFLNKKNSKNKKKNTNKNKLNHSNVDNNLGDNNNHQDKKIMKLLNTIYFNIFLLRDKGEEHIKKLLKSLKHVNTNLILNNSQNEYNLLIMLLLIQNKRYIYQSLSMYVYIDIKNFFNILVKENALTSIIDEWLNDIFYIYQNSDDLKYFIFAFSNILIFFCLYHKKKKADGNENNNENIKESSFLKTDSINDFDSISKDIYMEYFNEYVIEKLKERLRKIINVLVNIILILPIPYEDNIKVFNKNLLRRLAPICSEFENIKDDNLFKLNSDTNLNDNQNYLKEIQFDDLIQNIEFMHLNNYDEKFYERKNTSLKIPYSNILHINQLGDLQLHEKKISINYCFQNNINNDFINNLISESNCEYFKISFYVKKSFSLLTQEIFTSEELINIIGCSDKYYNFINIIRLDI
ncbi:conserved Plasmodium protein, unknown function [Plasmodium relictum]|uniref:Uncharacterized protein n=1 Tax=Plasmodium relictum TaxID=85471 RepID=A0A1J1H7T9_PLARL|nr:conserved Plasmodium protein, unknown function [Plasmodium relictum]CRH00731.1 conserved Plasmodium protein, unknown function [Plasmodium relictum]